MAHKRQPVSFPEFEARGRRAILRTPEEVQAETVLLENQQAGMPADGQADQPEPPPQYQNEPMLLATHPDASIPERQIASIPAVLIKATYRLSAEAIEAIEDAKRILRRQYNLRVNLETIAEQAILAAYNDLLENQQASTLVTKLTGTERRKKNQYEHNE